MMISLFALPAFADGANTTTAKLSTADIIWIIIGGVLVVAGVVLGIKYRENIVKALRVYKSESCKGAFADDNATLASIRAEGKKGGELVVGGNLKVGNFEKKIAELYGIGVQVANADDSKLADNDITLVAAGK